MQSEEDKRKARAARFGTTYVEPISRQPKKAGEVSIIIYRHLLFHDYLPSRIPTYSRPGQSALALSPPSPRLEESAQHLLKTLILRSKSVGGNVQNGLACHYP